MDFERGGFLIKKRNRYVKIIKVTLLNYKRRKVFSMLIIGFIALLLTLFAIEAKLRKTNKQNDEIIELLKKLNDKHQG